MCSDWDPDETSWKVSKLRFFALSYIITSSNFQLLQYWCLVLLRCVVGWSVEHSLIWWVKELFICLTDLQYRQIYHFVSCLFIFFLFLSTQWEFLYRLCLSVGICMESVGIFLIIKQWCSQKHLFHCVVFIFTIKLSPKVVWRSCVWTKIEHKNNTSKNEPNASTQMEEGKVSPVWSERTEVQYDPHVSTELILYLHVQEGRKRYTLSWFW